MVDVTATPVADVTVVRRLSAPRPRHGRFRKALVPYSMILPSVVLVAVFCYYPAGKAIVNSVFDGSYGRMGDFIGIDNFVELFHDPVFGQAIWNMTVFTVVTATLSTVIPLMIAQMIFWLSSERAQSVYRILVMWPVIVPGIVTLLIWQFIYDGDSGMLNDLLTALGLGGFATSWLGNIGTALGAVIFTGFPWVGGLAVLIYLAGMKDIEREVFDAAAMDGATGLRRFWTIDRPLLAGQIRLNFILSVIGGTQAFVAPLVLTQGGPANATMVPGLYLYREAFTLGNLGYASAIGVTLFVIILGLTALFNTLLRNQR